MSEFLETLKLRMAEAQRRFQEAAGKLQAAQAESNAAAQEFTSWQKAVEVETRREATNQGIATVEPPAATKPVTTQDQGPGPEINQTQLIRDVIQNGNGLTPTEVWNAVKGDIGRRGYMYAVLGRLKDREEVTVRRGKYYPKIVKPGVQEGQMIQ